MSTLGNDKANGYVSGSDLDPTINLPANVNMLFTPTGGITSGNVKDALAELDRPMWLASLTDDQKVVVNSYYQDLLNATETGTIPNKPEFMK